MTPPSFLIPQTQHLSFPFLSWTKQSKSWHAEARPRYLFTMARYALYHGLRASRLASGDEILMPAYICDAAVEAVRAFGAVPVFYRITRDCLIDFEDIQGRISSRSKALLFVHYFGFAQELKPLREFADTYKLLLIEDCAHVLSGRSEGRPLGSAGDFSIFSWRKFLPVLDGAELRFNSISSAQSPELRREPLMFDLKALKYLLDMRLADGFSRTLLDLPLKFFRSLCGISASGSDAQGPQASDVLKLDGGSSVFNSSFADSSISRVSHFVLTHSDVDAITVQRRKNYAGLAERLAQVSGVSPLHSRLPENTCPLHLPVFIRDIPGAHRVLRQQGIPATAWDGVRPSSVSDTGFPDAAFLYENLVFLPIHQNLHERDLDMISDAVKKISGGTCGARTPIAADIEAVRPSTRKISATQNKVLMIAFHYPPLAGSSGLLRTLKNSRYLPSLGWSPTVLTSHPRAYDRVDESQLSEIPAAVKVIRAFALDTQKHLSLKGRYFLHTALPDRWVTWALGAMLAGDFEISRNKINVILTTFPIASAVLAGYLLHRMTGIPWVADFRDSMTEKNYPRDPRTRQAYLWLEEKAVRQASRLIFTAESTRQMYLHRYPQLSPEKCLVISNGYDEEDFAGLPEPSGQARGRVRIQHSGLIYPEERNPVPFFRALAQLKKQKAIEAASLSVDLRACGNDERYKQIVTELGIADIVNFLPALPYRQALEDSSQSDGLLLLQGASCDHQIPAKAYEYLRLRKPILALTSNTGDTVRLLNECSGATIIDIADEEAIVRGLPAFLKAVQDSTHPLPAMHKVSQYSRQNQARQLASCLFSVIGADDPNEMAISSAAGK